MTGLVLELQRDALNSEIKVSNLLRKALVVSKKLGIVEIEEWINNELNGYLIEDNEKEYRMIHGEIKAFNSYNGAWLQLVDNTDLNISEKISSRYVFASVTELESLLDNDDSLFPLNFPEKTAKVLMEITHSEFTFFLVVQRIQFIKILNFIRNKILDWSLELEKKGILGEGMSFSEKEKQLAHQTTNISIQNMHNSQLQLDSPNATQSLNVTADSADLKKLVEDLKNAVDDLALQHEQREDLNEAIAMLSIQAHSAKPKNVIINESLHTIRNVLEGTAGSIVASGLIYQLGLFLTK